MNLSVVVIIDLKSLRITLRIIRKIELKLGHMNKIKKNSDKSLKI